MCEDEDLFLRDKLPSDILQIVSENDIPNVLEKLKQDWPHSMSIHTFISKRLEWARKDPKEKFYVLCPNSSWENGTVISVAAEDFQVVMYTLEEGCCELKKALMKTKLINWNKRLLQFPYIHEKHIDALKELLQYKNVNLANATVFNDTFYIIPEEKANCIQSQCPPGMFLAPLEPHHIKLIYDEWLYKAHFSVKYVRKIIEFNETIGLFTCDSKELVCWV